MNNSIRSFVMINLGLLLVAGCGDKPAPKPPAAKSPNPSATASPAAPPAAPLAPPAAVPAPPPPPGGVVQPAVSKAPTINRAMLDEDGKQLTTLQFLQRMVEQYDRVRPGTATADADGWPELTDLAQLVKYHVVKELPTPPAGQKFALDPKTHKVSLVSQ